MQKSKGELFKHVSPFLVAPGCLHSIIASSGPAGLVTETRTSLDVPVYLSQAVLFANGQATMEKASS